MDLETKLSIPPQVMSRLVGDETVLLDLASGGIEQICAKQLRTLEDWRTA